MVKDTSGKEIVHLDFKVIYKKLYEELKKQTTDKGVIFKNLEAVLQSNLLYIANQSKYKLLFQTPQEFTLFLLQELIIVLMDNSKLSLTIEAAKLGRDLTEEEEYKIVQTDAIEDRLNQFFDLLQNYLNESKTPKEEVN